MHYRGLGILTLSVMIVACDSTSDAVDGVTEQFNAADAGSGNVEFTIDVPVPFSMIIVISPSCHNL